MARSGPCSDRRGAFAVIALVGAAAGWRAFADDHVARGIDAVGTGSVGIVASVGDRLVHAADALVSGVNAVIATVVALGNVIAAIVDTLSQIGNIVS